MENRENKSEKAVSPRNGQPVPSNPSGRPKGVPNKATSAAREAIARFIDGNVERLEGWLDLIAEKDPKQAFDCYMSVLEYNIPKLQRTDVQTLDKDGKPADASVTVIFK